MDLNSVIDDKYVQALELKLDEIVDGFESWIRNNEFLIKDDKIKIFYIMSLKRLINPALLYSEVTVRTT